MSNMDNSKEIDHTKFVLSPEKWEEFCDVLDAPPKILPAVKELFCRPSPFNEEKSEVKEDYK